MRLSEQYKDVQAETQAMINSAKLHAEVKKKTSKQRYKYWIYWDKASDKFYVECGYPHEDMHAWAVNNEVTLVAGPFASRKAAEFSKPIIYDFYRDAVTGSL